MAAGCGGTTRADAGGAEIVPAGAPAFIAVNTDTDSPQWQTVDNLASRFPDKQKATRMVTEAIRKEGLSWDRDVKPGIGPEVDLVWLDFDNGGQNFAVLLRPDDEQKFKRLTKEAESAADFFHTKIDEWQVMAPRQELIDRFRSESASGDSLADTKAFRQAMDAYPDDYLLRAYVDGAAVMKAARAEQDRDFQKILPKLGRLDWLATNLRVTPGGVRWDLNIRGTAGPALKGVTPSARGRSPRRRSWPSPPPGRTAPRRSTGSCRATARSWSSRRCRSGPAWQACGRASSPRIRCTSTTRTSASVSS
jgi:hypothetical protein